jgi:hypothetical protein
MIKNVYWSSFKYTLFLSEFNDTLNFLDGFWKNTQISKFMKIRPVVAELFLADGRTDKHDEANSRFSQFCERAYKRMLAVTLTCY